jgi:hypothetical protein
VLFSNLTSPLFSALMRFSKPVSAEINPLAGASRRYQKRLSDLNGLYLDESAFATFTAARGEEVAYEVYEPTKTQHAPSEPGTTRHPSW